MTIRIIGAAFVLFVLIGVAQAQTSSAQTNAPAGWVACHILEYGGLLPDGYGAPWNTISLGHELFFTILCNYDSALGGLKYELGNGATNVYVHNRGYNYVNGWREVSYSPAPGYQESGEWIIGKGVSAITTWEDALDFAGGTLFTLGYTCMYSNDTWKCGCRDSECRENYWQLQIYRTGI